MRPLLLPLLFLSTLSVASAQDAKPADPFVKTKPAAKPADAAPADAFTPVPPPTHLLSIFETYTLPQDALDALHASHLDRLSRTVDVQNSARTQRDCTTTPARCWPAHAAGPCFSLSTRQSAGPAPFPFPP